MSTTAVPRAGPISIYARVSPSGRATDFFVASNAFKSIFETAAAAAAGAGSAPCTLSEAAAASVAAQAKNTAPRRALHALGEVFMGARLLDFARGAQRPPATSGRVSLPAHKFMRILH